mgnify:CR=1 FL=1
MARSSFNKKEVAMAKKQRYFVCELHDDADYVWSGDRFVVCRKGFIRNLRSHFDIKVADVGCDNCEKEKEDERKTFGLP